MRRRFISPPSLASLAALAVLAVACKPKAKAPPRDPVTLDEAKAHAGKVAAALNGTCDPNALVELIDVKTLVFELAEKYKKDRAFADGMLTGAKQSLGVGLCRDIQPGDKTIILRTREGDGEVKALLRVLGDNGFNYHEHYISKRDGTVRSHDMYIYATGQKFSEMLSDLLKNFMGETPNLAGVTRMKSTMDQVFQLEAAGNFQGARDKLKELPAEMKDSRLIHLRDVMLAANLSDDEYAKAIAAYEKRFPNDTSLDMVSIDGFVLRKEWEKAEAAIDRLDARVGGDPYLEVLRGSFDIEAGKPADARLHFDKAIKAEPKLADAHWGLVNLGLSQKDNKLVADELKLLNTELKDIPDLPALLAAPMYVEFAKSPEAATLK